MPLFVTIFMEQWMKERNHVASIIGLILSALSLALLGGEHFVIPAMIAMLLCFLAARPKLESKLEKKEETK